MRREHLARFAPICPVCAGHGVSAPIRLERVVHEAEGHVIEGLLGCSRETCLREYPIVDGIPLLVADLRGHVGGNLLPYLEREDLSPVLESVLGDCAGPGSAYDQLRQRRANYAHTHWVAPAPFLALLAEGRALAPPTGLALDLGCAVGRNSFELAAHAEMVLGIDVDFSLLRVAARALREGRLSLSRRRVGLVYDRVEVEVDRTHAERVDFWLADVLALPLGAALADHVSSYNLIDCLSSPYAHLASVAGVLRPGGSALFATPYDWSGHTPMEGWIGGHSQRAADGGQPEARLRTLLERAGLTTTGEAEAGWPLRLHDRAEVHYRVHLTAAALR